MRNRTHDSSGCLWILPKGLKTSPDPLKFRVDIHSEAILLHRYREKAVETKLVSALDIARAFTKELRFHSGILPEGALWWSIGPEGVEVALWRKPQVWKVAIQMEAFKPPLRLAIPMPGLIFVCVAGRPPKIYAALRRPTTADEILYHAPLFNVFADGRSCPGTHHYPDRIAEIPESFFTAFFSRDSNQEGRSKSHPKDLLELWRELDGKTRYPVSDLVKIGTIEEVVGKGK